MIARLKIYAVLCLLFRLVLLIIIVACFTCPAHSQSKTDTFPPEQQNNTTTDSRLDSQPRVVNRLPEFPGARQSKRLTVELPRPVCLSEPFDSLLFHGVSGAFFSLKIIPACRQSVKHLTATELSGYQNFLPAARGGWSRVSEILPRWADDPTWLILGFRALDDEIILVEAENTEGDYQRFTVKEIFIQIP